MLASGHSHRTPTDAEMIRWGADLARIEGVVGDGSTGAGSTLEVALLREGDGGQRKRIRVNGVARRATSLAGTLRVVLFAPEEMLLIAGSPGLRRATLDGLVGGRSPVYAADLATYGRALQQRNSLLRAIREEQATREQLRFWDTAVIESGASVVSARLALLEVIAEPLRAAHREIAPEEGGLTLRYETNAPARPGESIRDALARRLAETAEKEVWNGSTLIGPHRDDLVFELDQDDAIRNLAGFASRGQQRTAILALKLAELQTDMLEKIAPDGFPPLLRSHQAISRQVGQVANQLDVLLQEMALNELGNAAARQLMEDKIIKPLRELHDGQMVKLRQRIDELAAGDRFEEADSAAARQLQQEIVRTMQQILAQMSQWESFVDVINQLRQIIKLQTELRDTTEQIKKKQTDELFDEGTDEKNEKK